jgi:hypothetical protein
MASARAWRGTRLVLREFRLLQRLTEIQATEHIYMQRYFYRNRWLEKVARYLDQRQVLMRPKCLDVWTAPADGSRTVVQVTMKYHSKPAYYCSASGWSTQNGISTHVELEHLQAPTCSLNERACPSLQINPIAAKSLCSKIRWNDPKNKTDAAFNTSPWRTQF